MEVIYIAEPIISTNINKLIAVELLSRFYSKTGVPLYAESFKHVYNRNENQST